MVVTVRRVLLRGLNQNVTELSKLPVIHLDCGIKLLTKLLSEFSLLSRLQVTLVELILSGAEHVLDLRQGGIAKLLNLPYGLLWWIVDSEL